MLTELFHAVGKAARAVLARPKRRERAHARQWLAALDATVRRPPLIQASGRPR